MKALKTIVLTVISGSLLIFSHYTGGAEGAASCEASSYELMSKFIQEEYGIDFSMIVINSETESWCLSADLSFLREEWQDLDRETIDSLIVKNSGQTQQLSAEFELPVEFKLVPEQSYMEALQVNSSGSGERKYLESGNSSSPAAQTASATGEGSGPDWEEFDRRFPDAQGYLTFSRIGFNSVCSQALLIYSNAYRCSGNTIRPKTRKIAYFRNVGGAWELVGISKPVAAMY